MNPCPVRLRVMVMMATAVGETRPYDLGTARLARVRLSDVVGSTDDVQPGFLQKERTVYLGKCRKQ
jgi:hypothetical protein